MGLEFKKKLGLTGAVAVTIGGVIGVGIFVIVGPMGARAGGWLPVAMIAAAVPAIFGTIVSAALGSTIPADGGAYMYSRRLMNKFWGAAASICVILGAFGAMGTVSIGLADYLMIYLPDFSEQAVSAGGATAFVNMLYQVDQVIDVRIIIAWAIILFIYLINRAGVLATAWLQILLVAQLVTALVILVFSGFLQGAPPDMAAGLPKGLGGFTEATILAALAYTGFNIIAELGDEVENPRRNIPLTIVIGLGIIIILYVGMGWVVTGNLSIAELETSNVAAVDASLKLLPRWFIHYINFAALGAAATSINAVFLAVPREFMALANDAFLPRKFLAFNEKTQTFTFSLAVVLVTAMILVAPNFEAENYGIMAVVGLYLVNGIVSFGCLTLFKRFPEKVQSSPLSLRPGWLKPCAVVSGILSLGLGVLGMIFVPVVGLIFFAAGGLIGVSIWRVSKMDKNISE